MFRYSDFANYQGGANSTINNNKRRSSRNKKRKESYGRYIRQIMRMIRPDMQLASKTIAILDDFIMDIFLRIAREASDLANMSKRKTLMVRDIEAAIRLILVGDLIEYALLEGKKSVITFDESRRANNPQPTIKFEYNNSC